MQLLNEGEINTHDKIGDVKTFYHRIYFDAIDTIAQCVEDHFKQPGLKLSRDVEMLLLLEYDDELNNACSGYREKVNCLHLSIQL